MEEWKNKSILGKETIEQSRLIDKLILTKYEKSIIKKLIQKFS